MWLKVETVRAGYGPIRVLHGVSLQLDSGTTTVLLGSNGVGKSTLMKVIAGLVVPSAGSVILDGRDITHDSPQARVGRGLSLVPEGRRLFTQLTVLENLQVGANPKRARGRFDEGLALAFDTFPILGDKRKQLAGQLSGGQQQVLAIARSMMGFPSVLLLDEPTLGLAPIAIDSLRTALERLREQTGIALLIADQNADLALNLADSVLLMRGGRIVRSGDRSSFADLSEIEATYLEG